MFFDGAIDSTTNKLAVIKRHASLLIKSAYMKLYVTALVLMGIASNALAQSASLNIDANTFIDAINTWLTMAISITAIGVGIAGAFALARYVGRMILDAFNGKM